MSIHSKNALAIRQSCDTYREMLGHLNAFSTSGDSDDKMHLHKTFSSAVLQLLSSDIVRQDPSLRDLTELEILRLKKYGQLSKSVRKKLKIYLTEFLKRNCVDQT